MTAPLEKARATMTWVQLPTLRFTMGSDRLAGQNDDDEGPVRDVSVGSISVLAEPVSVAAFAAFVEDAGVRTVAQQEGSGFVRSGDTHELVSGPSWQDPDATGTRASDHSPVRQISWFDALEFCRWSGTRLLTEAEWERCARHGITTMSTSPDLEWVADYYDATFHRTEQRVNPVGPIGGTSRVARGGGSVSRRTAFLPDMTSNDLTFRVVDVT